MQKLIFFSLLALAFSGCGKGEATPENTLKIAGHVYCVGKKGLANVELTCVSASGSHQTVFTAADGSFEISGLAAGETHSILAMKSGSYFDGVTQSDLDFVDLNTSASLSTFQTLALLQHPTTSATLPNDYRKTIQNLVDKNSDGITSPVWHFAEPTLTISSGQFSAVISFFDFKSLTANVADFQIVAVKFGDVNSDYCP